MKEGKRDSLCDNHIPIVLTIAGSDSSGGAGVQADIRVISCLGCYAMSVVTAITAQNTLGIKSKTTVSSDLIKDQLSAVLDDIRPDAVKIGMLPDIDTTSLVIDAIKRYNLKNIVVDPIHSSTSGTNLSFGYKAIAHSLYKYADILTPNLPEASQLLGKEIGVNENRYEICRELMDEYGCKAIYLKGGHTQNNECHDTFMNQDHEVFDMISMRIESRNTHGTGCTLSSALASFLAQDYSQEIAARKAHDFVNMAISKNCRHNIGHGYGPLLFNI